MTRAATLTLLTGWLGIVCAFAQAAVESGQRPGQGSVPLRLDLEILSQRYCEGDSEVGTIQLRCKLRLTNVGHQPLVLYKGSAVISKVVVARSWEELKTPRPEFEMLITNVADNSHPVGKGDKPGQEFVILQPNQVFEANGLIPIPFKRDETRIRS